MVGIKYRTQEGKGGGGGGRVISLVAGERVSLLVSSYSKVSQIQTLKVNSLGQQKEKLHALKTAKNGPRIYSDNNATVVTTHSVALTQRSALQTEYPNAGHAGKPAVVNMSGETVKVAKFRFVA